MKTRTSLNLILTLLLVSPPALAATKFYRWTDDQGVTHYTAEPPPSNARSTGEVKVRNRSHAQPEDTEEGAQAGTAGSAKNDKAAGKDKEKDKPKEKARDDKAEGNERYAERCKGLRADLKTLQENARIRIAEEGGEGRILTEEEKSSKQDEVQRQIKAFCE